MRNLVWHCCTPEAHKEHMEHMCHLARHAHLSAIQVFRSIWQLWFSSVCNSLSINLLYHLIREGMVTLSYSQNCTYSCGDSMRCRKLCFYAHSDIHSQLEGIGTENPAATQLLQWMLQILTMVDQISETLVVRGSYNLFQHEKWAKTWGADFKLLLFNVSTALTLSEWKREWAICQFVISSSPLPCILDNCFKSQMMSSLPWVHLSTFEGALVARKECRKNPLMHFRLITATPLCSSFECTYTLRVTLAFTSYTLQWPKPL